MTISRNRAHSFSKSKRVAIVGFYGAGNFGDEIMLKALADRILAFGEVSVLAYDFAPLWIEDDLHDGVRIVKYHRGGGYEGLRSTVEVFLEILRSDIVVFGGGTFLLDNVTRSYRNMLGVLRTTLFCRLLRRKILHLGVGIGKLTTHNGRRLARFILNSAEQVALRDQESFREAKHLITNNSTTVKQAADLVFLNGSVKRDNFAEQQNNRQGFTLAFCGMEFDHHSESKTSHDELSNNLASVFDILVERYGIQLRFVPMQLEHPLRDDHRFHQLIYDKMEHKYAASLLDGTKDRYTQTIVELQTADLVVGMRLHSLATAIACETPVFGLVLTEKVRRLLRESELTNHSLSINEAGNVDLLVSALEDVIQLIRSNAYPIPVSYLAQQRQLAEVNLESIVTALSA